VLSFDNIIYHFLQDDLIRGFRSPFLKHIHTQKYRLGLFGYGDVNHVLVNLFTIIRKFSLCF